MTYPELNSTLVSNNLAEILVYANTVTHQWFGITLVISFFITILLASSFMQFRYSGRIKPETSFLASSFATLGFAVILEQYSGILNTTYFFILIAITILCFIWVVFSSD
jgi:hypothetical protein